MIDMDDYPAINCNEGTDLETDSGIYTLKQKLGKGGFGEVWLAEKTSKKTGDINKIALKVPYSYKNTTKYLKIESDILSGLDSPNIIRTTGYETFANQMACSFLVMEYCDGDSLANLINKHYTTTRHPRDLNVFSQYVKIPDKMTAYIAYEIANGLEALENNADHDKRIIHHDIKPGNILITKNGEVKIIDFGLSQTQKDASKNSENIKGTPNYFSPEKILFYKPDPRSDQYSLGVIMYEMLTGIHPNHPWTVKLTSNTYKNHYLELILEDLVEPSQIVKRTNKRLSNIVKKMLHFDPEERFRSIRYVKYELTGIIGDERADIQNELVQLMTGSPKKRKDTKYELTRKASAHIRQNRNPARNGFM